MTDATDSGPLPVQGGIFGGMSSQPLGWGDPTGSSPAQQPGAGASALGPQSPLAPGLGDVQSQIQASTAKERQALAGPMSKLNAAQQGRPQTPNLKTNNEPPPDAKEYQKNAMEWASAFAVLGAIAGRFTRAPGGAALGAFASAVKGWQSGNLQAYESASKEWEEKNKQAIQNNKTVLEKYKLALEDSNRSIDEQMSAIQLIAAQYHDPLMYQAAGSKNFTLVGQIYEKNVFQTDKAERAAGILSDTRRGEEAQQALVGERVASGQINPDGLNPQTGQPWTEANKKYFQYTREQYLSGAYTQGKIPKPAGGLMGQIVAQENSERAARGEPRMTAQEEISFIQKAKPPRSGPAIALQKYIEEHPDATSDDLQEFQARQAGISAEERAVGVRAGGIGLAVDEADRTVPNVRALAQKVAGKGYATWNAVESRWNVEKGDRDFAKYVQQINSLINIYGRVISGGGKGTVSDLEHGRQMLNPNMPLSAVEGSLDGFETEIEIAKEAPERVRAKIRGGGQGAVSGAAPGTDNAPSFSDRFTGSPASNDDGWTVKEK